MVSGYAWNGSDGWYSSKFQYIIDALAQYSVPHASILGNHDYEADLSRRQIAELEASSSPFSLTRAGPDNITGAMNFWLDIGASDGSGHPAARIWMFDSMDAGCNCQSYGWGCVHQNTLRWAQEQMTWLPHVPSLSFIHIPVPEFMYAWLAGGTAGSKEESVSCPSGDWHSFKDVRDLGVSAIYSGHDHANDYVGKYRGMRLAYGRKSGHGGYGPPDGWLHGARVIVLREGEDPADSETYLRLEDGSKVEQGPSGFALLQQLMCAGHFRRPAVSGSLVRSVQHPAGDMGRKVDPGRRLGEGLVHSDM